VAVRIAQEKDNEGKTIVAGCPILASGI